MVGCFGDTQNTNSSLIFTSNNLLALCAKLLGFPSFLVVMIIQGKQVEIKDKKQTLGHCSDNSVAAGFKYQSICLDHILKVMYPENLCIIR